jgi:hypothetical protein
MRDHRNGIIRRHHVLDVTFQKAIREAVNRAGFDKRVSPHTPSFLCDASAGQAGQDQAYGPRTVCEGLARSSIGHQHGRMMPLHGIINDASFWHENDTRH